MQKEKVKNDQEKLDQNKSFWSKKEGPGGTTENK